MGWTHFKGCINPFKTIIIYMNPILQSEVDASTQPSLIIKVKILNGLKAEQINGNDAGKEHIIGEIMLGTGNQRKAVKYTSQFLARGYECEAVVISPGKIRIV